MDATNPGHPWQAERMATMERAEAIAFLTAGTRTGKLATASRSGAVSVAPVWFVLDDATNEAVFTTGATTLKGRHLTENPRAALTVDVSEFPYHFVVVRGTVSVQENPSDMVAWATRIAARYVPEGQAAAYGRRNGVPGELLCRLRLERVRGEREIAL
jgi:PPOX class probable F420-dependent enzyme